MANDAATAAWPTELVFRRGAKRLDVTFDDGVHFAIPFELLRVESPSAEVQGHSASQKKVITGKENVAVVRTEPVGRYGVRIVFDDGHNSGLFTWAWIYKLGLMSTQVQ